MTQPTPASPTPEGPDEPRGTPAWLVPALVGIIVVLVAAIAIVLVRDDDDDVATIDTPSTTVESTIVTSTTETTETTTTTTSTTTTTVVQQPSDGELDTVVWPGPDTGLRYSSAEEAARGFAEDLAGFDDPVLGPYMSGDSRSGEIEVSSTEGDPVSTLFVRQLSDDNWWVLGAVTESIALDEPEAGDDVTSPLPLEGRSRAFEATVNVSIFGSGDTDPLGETVVMGGAFGDLEPFSGEITYDAPGTSRGVLMLYTISARDGGVLEVIALPVGFDDA